MNPGSKGGRWCSFGDRGSWIMAAAQDLWDLTRAIHGLENLEILKTEVESLMGIPLKTMLRQLINEKFLKNWQDVNNERKSVMVITVSSDNEAKRMVASGCWFGKVMEIVEKYWDAGSGSVFLRCYGIGYERQNSCGNRSEQCIMCARAHQVSEY